MADAEISVMDKVISLCKRRGFVFPGSEIYGGLANTWDYGPYGVLLKNNLKQLWWKTFVQERDDMVGLDAAILMNPRVWEASGHVENFSDPLVDCKSCKERFRGDKLIEEKYDTEMDKIKNKFFRGKIESLKSSLEHLLGKSENSVGDTAEIAENLAIVSLMERMISSLEKFDRSRLDQFQPNKKNDRFSLLMDPLRTSEVFDLVSLFKDDLKFISYFLTENKIPCPKCGKCNFTEARAFNCMFRTYQGVIEETAALVYLRPETAQGIFTNFKNVLNTSRKKIPFGIAQIGKSFRNEITPGNFTFRTREFEQMEIEYFIKEKDWEPLFDEWEKAAWDFFKKLGIAEENLRFRPHDSKELSHYSKRTKDVEYRFPFGWGELMGLAYRTDFDLRRHMEFSGEKLTVLEEDQEPFIPHVIEPSFGVDRTLLTVLLDAYHEDEVEGEVRVVMRFAKALAPIKVAVLPLSKKLEDDAKKVSDHLKKFFSTEFDVSGSIGKRYRRQDEIGTPYCVTFDFDSLNDQKVTVRDRDAMTQDRVPIEGLEKFLGEKLAQ